MSASLHALPFLILPQIIKDKCAILPNSHGRPAVPSRLPVSLPDTAFALEFSWQQSCRCAKQNGIQLGCPLLCGLSKAHRIHTCLCLEIQQLQLSTQQTELQKETTPCRPWLATATPSAQEGKMTVFPLLRGDFLAIAPKNLYQCFLIGGPKALT